MALADDRQLTDDAPPDDRLDVSEAEFEERRRRLAEPDVHSAPPACTQTPPKPAGGQLEIFNQPPPQNTVQLDHVAQLAELLLPHDRMRLIARLWQSLPTESWPALDDNDVAAVRRKMIESSDRWMDPVPWPIVERLLIGSSRSHETRIYAAPRRFDLATIFIVTVAYSLLFSAMSLLQFPPVISLAIAGFVTSVGLGQAVLFGGAQPRTASLIMGAVIFSIGMLAYWVLGGSRYFPPSVILVFGSFIVIGGAVLGYLSGALIGGVFMLAEYLRRFVRSVVRQPHVEVRDED